LLNDKNIINWKKERGKLGQLEIKLKMVGIDLQNILIKAFFNN
jgi:hypothetical protein